MTDACNIYVVTALLVIKECALFEYTYVVCTKTINLNLYLN